ncbi:uncharacterized protein PHACADRAFT_82680 [Phanerochaete carnosa HHB-10118-sp]|uniref:Ribosomal protein S16 n=1 Tax=Phanerochaete carnosa (strain HHB-10118-sp) TaxID=650164 RepID=K5WP47_PHACS|nr:uncharacterized protein PHACADRAFT_82680 [Phanerochaete carnosa HHB-10118-sp]EKM61235.1 hypothetical protein PHACADRAFT_82680 [Phanerochaete carnosa HHB-10118-sp]
MPVRLRFALHGPRHNRVFHMVAIDSHVRRNARPLETLAIYDPQLKSDEQHKTVKWSSERIKYWLRQGAQPSGSVVNLLTLGGILTPNSRYHRMRDERMAENRSGSKA